MAQDAGSPSWLTNPMVTWAIAIVVGVVSSIIASFLYPKLIAVLESSKAVSLRSRYRAASRFNQLINDLHYGRRNRNDYFVEVNIALAVTFLAGAISVFSATVILALSPSVIGIDYSSEPSFKANGLIIACYIFALITVTLAVRLYMRLKLVSSALDDFESYTASYKKKWGGSNS